MGKVKESNFELVKIVAMLMIVCHHLVTQNAYNIDTELVGLNGSRVFLQLIGNHAFIANNLFFYGIGLVPVHKGGNVFCQENSLQNLAA